MKEKRKSNESSDSEDDIWEYKSVKRVRKKPDFDEVSKSSNIAQTKMTVKRRGKSSLTQNTAEDTDSNTTVFKVTSKNKRNKAASKAGAIGDIVNGKDVKTKGSRTRQSVASMRSVGSSPSQQLQETLHNHNNSKGATSASTSKQRGGLSQKTSSQTSSRGGKGGTGRKSSTKKKASQQTPQSKIPEVNRRFWFNYQLHGHLLGLQFTAVGPFSCNVCVCVFTFFKIQMLSVDTITYWHTTHS